MGGGTFTYLTLAGECAEDVRIGWACIYVYIRSSRSVLGSRVLICGHTF